jgi:hypothetical protein
MPEEALPRVQPTGKRGGRWIPIGDQEYRVPALSFGQLEDLQEVIEPLRQGVVGMPTKAQMGAVQTVVHWALQRNYPELTLEEVGGMLDLSNYSEVFGAVMGVSGMTRRAQEGGFVGEPKAPV